MNIVHREIFSNIYIYIGKMKFSKLKIFVDKNDLTCELVVSHCI